MKDFFMSIGDEGLYPPNGVRVILMTGQSNSRGRAKISELDLNEGEPNPNVMIWNESADEFQVCEIGVNNMGASLGNFGIEIEVMDRLENYFPDETIYIIKLGVGSSRIETHLLGGVNYVEFWNNYVVRGVNRLLNEGKTPFCSLYWSQGESNLRDIPQEYTANFNSWINLWQGNLGIDLPITSCEISDGEWAEPEPVSIINNVFHAKDITEPYYQAQYTKDYPVFSTDSVHYNKQGIIMIGGDVFNYFKNFIGVPISSPLS